MCFHRNNLKLNLCDRLSMSISPKGGLPDPICWMNADIIEDEKKIDASNLIFIFQRENPQALKLKKMAMGS